MKTYNKLMAALVLAAGFTLTACDESFLDMKPNDRITKHFSKVLFKTTS